MNAHSLLKQDHELPGWRPTQQKEIALSCLLLFFPVYHWLQPTTCHFLTNTEARRVLEISLRTDWVYEVNSHHLTNPTRWKSNPPSWKRSSASEEAVCSGLKCFPSAVQVPLHYAGTPLHTLHVLNVANYCTSQFNYTTTG